MRDYIEDLFRDNGGAVRRRDHPALARRLDRLRRTGELTTILPGVLVRSVDVDQWPVRLRAGLLWAGSDAVVTRHAAARLSFWPACPGDEISFAAPSIPRTQPGWPVMQARIPPEMQCRVHGVRITSPAYTAVELAAELGGDVIDEALRSRMASLSEMWTALSAMPNRPGNQERGRLLHDSRDRPWSELERSGHRLMRRHRIKGWQTNAWVVTAAGGYQVDVLFRDQRVIVEFDGYEFHHDRVAFERDRKRRNELELAGYLVLNFTWAQVHEHPDWVINCIVRALARS